jgi:NAD(P)-dependent dehydrogenase (short-subunit alcohol dehydrogenase family)
MDLQLQNKRSLVTGSTAGIGFAIAEALAREGASVIINGRSQQSVDDAVDRLRPNVNGTLTGFAGDLAREDVAEKLASEHPDIDILVNSLGIFEPVPFEQIPDEDWRRFFEINVLSGVRLSRLCLPGMKQRNWGRILFISSESGVQIPPEMIHYGMTKAAQIAIARGLAESVAGTGITVNSVLPGPTRSRGVVEFVGRLAKEKGKTLDEFETGFVEEMRPSSIIKRFATTEEVASLVTYIASPLASATTGAALRVDGGVIRSAF